MRKMLMLLALRMMLLCAGAAAEEAPAVVDRINHPEETFSFAPGAELMEIVFPQELNVDSAVIRCGGQVMLIDCASRAMAPRMVNLLEQLGVTEVDFVAVTHPHYDHLEQEVFHFLSERVDSLRMLGVRDIILDPGFGFAKTVEQNWQLLREMAVLQEFGKEILVGLSRKSFLFRPLGITPADALPATQVADFIALQNGADILRVHDVAEAVRTVKLYRLFNQASA